MPYAYWLVLLLSPGYYHSVIDINKIFNERSNSNLTIIKIDDQRNHSLSVRIFFTIILLDSVIHFITIFKYNLTLSH